jgi:hypothetical protein
MTLIEVDRTVNYVKTYTFSLEENEKELTVRVNGVAFLSVCKEHVTFAPKTISEVTGLKVNVLDY